MRAKWLVLLAACVTTAGCNSAADAGDPADPNPLLGAWRVVELQLAGAEATPNANPEPGVLLFTDSFYSRMLVTSEGPRPALPPDTARTLENVTAVWGPFTANSGTYVVSGTKVTYRPLVAKNPGVMAPDNFFADSFAFAGDTLVLVQESARDEPVENGVRTKLVRVR